MVGSREFDYNDILDCASRKISLSYFVEKNVKMCFFAFVFNSIIVNDTFKMEIRVFQSEYTELC